MCQILRIGDKNRQEKCFTFLSMEYTIEAMFGFLKRENVCGPESEAGPDDSSAPDFRQKPVLIYDGDCGFCKIWVRYWQKLTAGKVHYAPFQRVAGEFPRIPEEKFIKAVQLVLPSGNIFSAAHAVVKTLTFSGRRLHRIPLFLYNFVPPCGYISEIMYRFVEQHRPFFYSLTLRIFGTTTTNRG